MGGNDGVSKMAMIKQEKRLIGYCNSDIEMLGNLPFITAVNPLLDPIKLSKTEMKCFSPLAL